MNRTILRGFVLCLVVALLLVTQARLGFPFERSDSPCVLEQQGYDRRRVDVAGPHVHHLWRWPNSTLIPAKSASFVMIANPPSRVAVQTSESSRPRRPSAD
jgi:hypothetical protein